MTGVLSSVVMMWLSVHPFPWILSIRFHCSALEWNSHLPLSCGSLNTTTYLFQKLISHEINLLFFATWFFLTFFHRKKFAIGACFVRFDMVYNGVLSYCRARCIRGGHGGVCAGCLSLQERSWRSASWERGTTTWSFYSKC